MCKHLRPRLPPIVHPFAAILVVTDLMTQVTCQG